MRKLSFILTFTILSVSLLSTAYASNYRLIKDAMGRIVKVQEPVKRIVSLYSMIPPFVYLLGEGREYYSGTLFGEKFYKLLDPALPDKISRGKNANVEQVIKDRPQVVLCAYWQADERDVKQLESIGVAVMCTKLESVEDIDNTILNLGKIFQKEKRASEIVSYYTKIEKEVESKVKSELKPSVLVLYYSGHHHSFRTFGGDMFQSKLVELAGGTVVSKELKGKKDIDIEQILKWNPSVVMIIQYGKSAQKIRESILNNPIWKKVKAVEDDKVYAVPSDGENWIDPCPKWPLGLYWAAKILHPKEFESVNIEVIAKNFYKSLFNLDMSRVKITGDI